ncbi:MAG: MATE family efflux transporter [Bacteroidia bacterium]
MNRTILRLAIPNILSNIAVPLLGLVDTALMGRMESEAYLGAIALGGIMFSFIYWGLGFIRMGTTGLTAQAFGRQDPAEGIAVLARALLVGGIATVILLILQLPLGEFGFRLLEAEAKGDDIELVKQLSREYFYIRIWAAPANIGLMALLGWFLGMQNARFPMILIVAVNLFNILFNFLFIYGFDMKSDGVAWGTVVAQYLGLTIAIILFAVRYREHLQYLKRETVLQMSKIKQFFSVNADIFIRTMLLVFSLAFVNAKSFALDDNTLAINAILMQYFLMMSYAVDGFAYAAESLTGRFVGEGSADQLRIAVKKLLIWGSSFGAIFALVYLAFGKAMLHIFTDQSDLIEAAAEYVPWLALIALLAPLAFVWDGIYIGATATKAMRNTMIIAVLFIFLPTYYLSIDSLYNHGIWLSMTVLMVARGALLSLSANKHIFGILKG